MNKTLTITTLFLSLILAFSGASYAAERFDRYDHGAYLQVDRHDDNRRERLASHRHQCRDYDRELSRIDRELTRSHSRRTIRSLKAQRRAVKHELRDAHCYR